MTDYCADVIKEELMRRQSVNPRYSLRTLAKDLKISQSFLSKILSGKNKTSPLVAYKFGKLTLKSDLEIYKLLESTLKEDKELKLPY